MSCGRVNGFRGTRESTKFATPLLFTNHRRYIQFRGAVTTKQDKKRCIFIFCLNACHYYHNRCNNVTALKYCNGYCASARTHTHTHVINIRVMLIYAVLVAPRHHGGRTFPAGFYVERPFSPLYITLLSRYYDSHVGAECRVGPLKP